MFRPWLQPGGAALIEMRPSVVLLGFLLGSAGAITFALAGVVIVFGLLRFEHPRLDGELPALLLNFSLFALLTALAGASFYGEIKGSVWRRAAQVALLAGVAFIAWVHWPS